MNPTDPKFDPKFVPKLARKVARWQRRNAGPRWALQAIQGTKFVAPPSLPALALNRAALSYSPDTGVAQYLPDEATVRSHTGLAEYYAETLERAACFHLSDELTNLALRTGMAKYKLTINMLPKQKPCGFMTWAIPIGDAENYGSTNVSVDLQTGELDAPLTPSFNPFSDAEIPVVAVSWRYEPDAHVVWLAFYTYPQNMSDSLQRRGASNAEVAKFESILEPLAFEREQALPLDQELNWCDADPELGGRLELTASADPKDYPDNLKAKVIERDQEARKLVSVMVKNVLASWMLINWKIANQEVVPPPQDVIRRVAKEQGISRTQAAETAGTTVVRLGEPLQQRAPRKGDKQWTWKVRAIIGPFIRNRQYIPAYDSYDEEPRLIEPYFAGPPDAPLSTADKVFTLGVIKRL